MSKLIAAYKAVITAVSIDENIRGSKTAVKVGTEAETFVPLRKALSDKDFEEKIKATFGI